MRFQKTTVTLLITCKGVMIVNKWTIKKGGNKIRDRSPLAIRHSGGFRKGLFHLTKRALLNFSQFFLYLCISSEFLINLLCFANTSDNQLCIYPERNIIKEVDPGTESGQDNYPRGRVPGFRMAAAVERSCKHWWAPLLAKRDLARHAQEIGHSSDL